MKKHVISIPLLFLTIFIGFSYFQYSSYRGKQLENLQDRLEKSLNRLPELIQTHLESHLGFINKLAETLSADADKPVVFLKHERSEMVGFWILNPDGSIHPQSPNQNMGLEKNDRKRLLDKLSESSADEMVRIFIPSVSSQLEQPIFLLKNMMQRHQVLVTSFDGAKLFHTALVDNGTDSWVFYIYINNQLFWKSGQVNAAMSADKGFSWLNTKFRIQAFPGGSFSEKLVYQNPKMILIFGCILGVGFSLFMGGFLFINHKKREAESRYRMLFERANEGYFLLENDKLIRCNQKFTDLFGLDREQIEGQAAIPFFTGSKGQISLSETEAQRLFAGNGPSRFEAERHRSVGGSQVFLFHINPVTIYETQLVLGMVSDITQQKIQDRQIKDSEKRYRRLIEHAPEWIFITQDDLVKMPNSQAEKIIGYTPEEIVNKRFIDFIWEEDRPVFATEMEKLGRRPDKTSTFSVRMVNKAGEVIWLEIHSHLFEWEGQAAVLNFVRNISPEKKMEGQLFHAQKMEAVGTLAAGIAHDFNNLLQAIQGSISLAIRKHKNDEKMVNLFKGVEEHVKRGAKLTKQLLGFAKRGQYNVKPVLINEILERTASMFARTRKQLRMNFQFQKALWTVDVDEGQIDQVLLNLFMNAWQAMPDGGMITIRTENIKPSLTFQETYGLEDRNYVKISIVDTGIGMDKKTQERIFEPFFTLKDKKMGTGLGLASAYGIIKNHKGAIEVKSKLGEGSTFNIYLPISLKPYQKLENTTGRLFFGNETILVVDDEEQVLKMSVEMLEALGYRVLRAASGNDAVRIFQTSQSPIDLVILDIIMPDMNGDAVFKAMRQINSKQKILLCSGYSLDHVAKDLMKLGANGFLGKPFGIKILSLKVKETLHPEHFVSHQS